VSRLVNLASLKAFANEHLRDFPILRQMILQEPTELDAPEFVVKCGVWLRLAAEEEQRLGLRGATLFHDRAAVGERAHKLPPVA